MNKTQKNTLKEILKAFKSTCKITTQLNKVFIADIDILHTDITEKLAKAIAILLEMPEVEEKVDAFYTVLFDYGVNNISEAKLIKELEAIKKFCDDEKTT